MSNLILPEPIAAYFAADRHNPQAYAHLRAAARQTILDRYDLRRMSLPRLVAFVEGPQVAVVPV